MGQSLWGWVNLWPLVYVSVESSIALQSEHLAPRFMAELDFEG